MNPALQSQTLPSVLIAEDDERTRTALELILKGLSYPIAGQARDGREAVDMALDLKPGVLLLDIGMPVIDGLEAARLILARHRLPIVVLTGLSDEETLERARGIDIQAFLLKPVGSREQLHSAIAIATTLHARQRTAEARLAQASSAAGRAGPKLRTYGLTQRETEVLHQVASGRSNPQIALELELSSRTVEKHVEHIFTKLGVRSRSAVAQLVGQAARGRRRVASPVGGEGSIRPGLT